MIITSRFFNRSELIGFVALAVVLFVILPLSLDVFRLNLVAKYLTYAFVAIGLVLCWGYGGILSLGQGVFFGLGGNFLSATPDTEFTAKALERCRLTAHVSIKLNRSHLITGEIALILPCLGRTEIDRRHRSVAHTAARPGVVAGNRAGPAVRDHAGAGRRVAHRTTDRPNPVQG